MGVPFLICSLALNTFLSTFRKAARHMGVITKVGGALLILVGILLLTDSFSYLSELFNQLFPGISVG
jgi:cytochrome c-type biogenesis protein